MYRIDDTYTQEYYDPESLLRQDVKTDSIIRHGFVRKVYGIVLTQLAVTCIMAAYFTSNIKARLWILTVGQPLTTISGLFAMGLIIVLAFMPGISRRYPINLCILGGFTILISFALASECAYTAFAHNSTIILQGLVITISVFTALTAFAFQNKWDFTVYSYILFIGLMILMFAGILRICLPDTKIFETIYASCGALLFSAYIVMDTQLLIGKQESRFSPDDYIAAALAIYMDVINLFMYILQLLSSNDDN